MTVELRVVEDPAREAAALLVESGRVIALSGGSTAGPAYRLAAEARLDWTGMQVWFADERAVPPYDERSNYRLVRTTLIDALSRPPEMHRIKGELGAEEAAARYDDELEGVTLDFALNGIGADGHTASLFPGSPAIVSERRAVAA
jgi:6-phosphogluconolactonase